MGASRNGWGRIGVLAAALFGASVAAAMPAFAGDADKDFYGKDDRVEVETSVYPFSAIGRLEFESGGHCTASLVSDRVILTAAHCMFVERRRGVEIDRPLGFYAGYDQGEYSAVGRIVDWWFPETYDVRRHTRDQSLNGYDWAFLLLDAPIGAKTGTLDIYSGLTEDELGRAAEGEWLPVTLAGYGRDRARLQTAHIGCPVLQGLPDNTFLHRCDALEGNSGGPLFVLSGGRAIVVGIESLITRRRSDDVAKLGVAVDARAFAQAFDDYLIRVVAQAGG